MMLRFFRSLFAWREIARHGVWVYFENEVTGARYADRYIIGGHGGTHPAHDRWLAGGDWSYEKPRPPNYGLDVEFISRAQNRMRQHHGLPPMLHSDMISRLDAWTRSAR